MSSLNVTKESGVTTISLNRPEKRNALTVEVMVALAAAIRTADGDSSQRVVVLKGEGAAFCTGLDLKEAQDPERSHASAEAVADALRAIQGCCKVTIAAVHGFAIAGGAGLMSACDIVLAEEGTKIGYPETRRGLVAALVMSLLRKQCPDRAMRELLLTGELIDAARAREVGLVTQVVPHGALGAEVTLLTGKILQNAPGAIAETKRFMESLDHSTVEEDIQRAHKLHVKMRGSVEAQEGIAAFNEKRKPSWAP